MTEPQYTKTTTDSIARMADEGIPLRAIARSMKIPSDEVRDILTNALHSGDIVEMPKDDWPVGQKRDDRASATYKGMSEKDLAVLCCRVFKLAPLQGALLACLVRHNDASKDTLHNVVEGRRSPNKEPTDKKIVDVVICHVRREMKKFDIEISTIWGYGYCLQPDQRQKANDMLEKYLDSLTVRNVRASEVPVAELA